MTISRGGVLLTGAAVLVVASIGTALVMLGGPTAERERTLDERRASDLQSLSTWTDYYWQRHKALPASIEAVVRDRGGVATNTRDPVTGAPYEYRVVDGRRYELCATFARESGDGKPLPTANFWAHPAGRQCFTLEAKDAKGAEK